MTATASAVLKQTRHDELFVRLSPDLVTDPEAAAAANPLDGGAGDRRPRRSDALLFDGLKSLFHDGRAAVVAVGRGRRLSQLQSGAAQGSFTAADAVVQVLPLGLPLHRQPLDRPLNFIRTR